MMAARLPHLIERIACELRKFKPLRLHTGAKKGQSPEKICFSFAQTAHRLSPEHHVPTREIHMKKMLMATTAAALVATGAFADGHEKTKVGFVLMNEITSRIMLLPNI